ncbi:enamine deaminase RidA (YjgF/YER057c/UK114 family) [Bradyrhizobium sp. F1.4.3]|uniref:hypothetical protein n=1 Tax=Bradyrhizobium sp. F1.4.3 TaxID=3156356 RepID=UPI0033951680
MVTGGLRAGEFIAVANRTAEDADGVVNHPEDGVTQSHFIMERHADTLAALGASLQHSVKLEGYYFGNTREQWAPLSKARASHFREPGPAGTVVPCQRRNPKGALTKVEVMAMRELRNGYDKYIPREDHWPARVWEALRSHVNRRKAGTRMRSLLHQPSSPSWRRTIMRSGEAGLSLG